MTAQKARGTSDNGSRAGRVGVLLNKYKGSEQLLERYKSLIENSAKGNHGRESLAYFSGERLIATFASLNYTVNWNNINVLNPQISELAARSLDALERIISGCRENIDDYVGIFETIGNLYRNRQYSENIIPMVDTALSIINGWKNIDSDELRDRLRVLNRSITSCIGMISKLNKHGISERLDDNVFRLYPARKELIQLYLNRELTAMGDSFTEETEIPVMSLFSKIDDEIKRFIENNFPVVEIGVDRYRNGGNGNNLFKRDPAHIRKHIEMSRKVALYLGKNRIDVGEAIEIFGVEGLDGLRFTVNLIGQQRD